MDLATFDKIPTDTLAACARRTQREAELLRAEWQSTGDEHTKQLAAAAWTLSRMYSLALAARSR